MSNKRIELSQNNIVNLFFFLCGSLAGYSMLYSFYMLIIQHTIRIRFILSYIGRSSIWIVTLHLAAFRIVALIQIKYYRLPMTELNNLFRPIDKPYWWIAYTIVGIMIPIACKLVYNFLYKVVLEQK